MPLDRLIDTYGYWAILVGTLLEGETILLLGGFAAYQGYLALPWVILAAFIGAFCGDQLFFRGMHLTQVTPTYSIDGYGRLPANADGIRTKI